MVGGLRCGLWRCFLSVQGLGKGPGLSLPRILADVSGLLASVLPWGHLSSLEGCEV